MFYDGLLLIAWLLVAAFLLFLVFPELLQSNSQNRLIIQLYSGFWLASYFLLSWHKQQTLGMRAWRLEYHYQGHKYRAIGLRFLFSLTLMPFWGLPVMFFREDKKTLLDLLSQSSLMRHPK